MKSFIAMVGFLASSGVFAGEWGVPEMPDMREDFALPGREIRPDFVNPRVPTLADFTRHESRFVSLKEFQDKVYDSDMVVVCDSEGRPVFGPDGQPKRMTVEELLQKIRDEVDGGRSGGGGGSGAAIGGCISRTECTTDSDGKKHCITYKICINSHSSGLAAPQFGGFDGPRDF